MSPPVTNLRSEARAILTLAWPVVISRAGIMTMALVDTAITGQYGTRDLAYLALGGAVLGALFVGMIGLLNGTLVMTARYLGEGRPELTGAVWRRATFYAAILGVISLGLTWPGEWMLRLLGQEEDLARGGGLVMRIFGYGAGFQLIYVAGAAFLEGLSRPLPGMILMIIANIINAVLNWFLVFGHGGFPPMGAEGSAWATTIVRFFMAVATVAYIWFLPDRAAFGIRLKPEGGWRAWAEQRRLGYASGLSYFVEATAFSAMSIFAGWLGAVPLAAYTIVLNLLALIFMIALGLGTATAVQVSAAVGRGDFAAAQRNGWLGLGLYTIVGTLIGIAWALAPEPWVRVYTADPDLLQILPPLIVFSALVLVADGGQNIMASALRGRSDAWVPTASHFFSYLAVMMPLGYFLSQKAQRGVQGLLEAIVFASVLAAGFLCWRFYHLGRRDLKMRA